MKTCSENLILLPKIAKTKALKKNRDWIYSSHLLPNNYSLGDTIKLWGGITLKVVNAEPDFEMPGGGHYCIVPGKYSCFYAWRGHTEVCHKCYSNQLGIAFIQHE